MEETMAVMTFMAPVLPGKLDAWKQWCNDLAGSRRSEFKELLDRGGIVRHALSLQQTPQGDFAVVYLEGDDLTGAFKTLAESDKPFDVWFKENALEMEGLDLSGAQAGPISELMYDIQ
jgi:hypothetical protein